MIVGPQIVRDGLILHIDAGSQRCYVSGSTSGSNLVTGGLLTGASSGSFGTGAHPANPSAWPDYLSQNGGVFDWDGTTKGINVEEDLGNTGAATYCFWYYKPVISSDYLWDGRNDGGTYMLTNYLGGNLNGGNTFKYLFEEPFAGGSTLFLNRWQFIAVTSDSGGSDLYIDGIHYSLSPIYNNTLSGSNSINESFGTNFRIGTRYTGDTSWWDGQTGNLMFYNRVLTADEVRQNYNATCRRYGLNRV